MTFDDFVGIFLTDGAKAYLKESLRDGKSVHLYGAQGSGKSTLCEVFVNNGFMQVTEPGMEIFENIDGGAYALPRDIRGVSLIELRGMKKRLPADRKPFTRKDIEEWIA